MALAARLTDAARLTALGLHAPVIRAGANSFEVRPAGSRRPGTYISMPPEDLWRRTSDRIVNAAEQAASSGAEWLVIESLDNLWQLTPWSRQPSPAKASALAAETRTLLAATPRVHGIVFTDGAAITNLYARDADARPEPAVLAVRRRLDYVRTRETIVVALTSEGLEAFDTWVSLLDADAGFASWVMAELRLDAAPELLVRS